VKGIRWRWNGEGAAFRWPPQNPPWKATSIRSAVVGKHGSEGATQAVEIRGADSKVMAEKILRLERT